MEQFVITIGREFGSGGLDVGRMLSDNWKRAGQETGCAVLR